MPFEIGPSFAKESDEKRLHEVTRTVVTLGDDEGDLGFRKFENVLDLLQSFVEFLVPCSEGI